MAMRHNAAVVFSGAIAALAIMTVLSAAMGFALPNLMPKKYTHYGAAVLFLYFGVRLLKEGAAMEHGASEELDAPRKLGACRLSGIVAHAQPSRLMRSVHRQIDCST